MSAPKWAVKRIPDWSLPEMEQLLTDGWEPLAVTGGFIWLRRMWEEA